MNWIQVVLLAVGLSMDAFAVAIGTGASGRAVGARAVFRVAFHFGLFQALMPVAGWLFAASVRQYIGGIDHWVAFVLLWFVGLRMMKSGFDPDDGVMKRRDPSKGAYLIALAVATSIDALAVGVSLAFLGEQIWWPSLVIGIVTGLFSTLGMILGGSVGRRLGPIMEIIGGLVLLGIGVQIVVTHTAV